MNPLSREIVSCASQRLGVSSSNNWKLLFRALIITAIFATFLTATYTLAPSLLSTQLTQGIIIGVGSGMLYLYALGWAVICWRKGRAGSASEGEQRGKNEPHSDELFKHSAVEPSSNVSPLDKHSALKGELQRYINSAADDAEKHVRQKLMDMVLEQLEQQPVALDLSGIGISEIPECIASIPGLEKLNLADNNLTSITQIAKAKDLRVLTVYGNAITGFSGIKNLEKLERVIVDSKNSYTDTFDRTMTCQYSIRKPPKVQ